MLLEREREEDQKICGGMWEIEFGGNVGLGWLI